MPTAFVLINCSYEHQESLIDHLKTIFGIREIQETVGSYDILAKVESKNHRDLETIKENIRRLEKVKTATALVTKEVA